MLNVDLSTLRGQELRQLLDTTRRRGDAAVTYEILQEMAARRERGEPELRRGLFGPKRPAESRVIELNLGDPLDPKEPQFEAAFAPPHVEAWELEAAEPDDDEEATYLHPPREPDFDEPPPPKPKPRRRALWLSSGLAVGLVVGLALGGWAESVSQQGRSPLAVAAAAVAPPPAPPVATAPPIDPIAVETGTAPASPDAAPGAVTPIPGPPASSAAAPIPGAVPAAKAAPDPAVVAPEPVEIAEETAPEPVKPTRRAEKAAAVKEDTASPADSKAGACAGQPTPADRIICQTPRLQGLQKELRQAYADALDAHQDRDLLRERQLAWRDARNTVTEPDRLARLYEERIRKLNAAAAEARAGR
ncbi:MAG: hypothetical protein ACXU8S_06660 [Phenylobacterium sp.]